MSGMKSGFGIVFGLLVAFTAAEGRTSHASEFARLRSRLSPSFSLESESSDMVFVSQVPPPTYATAVPHTAIPGLHGPIFRSALPHGPELSIHGVTTSYENFNRALKKHPSRQFLGSRINEKGVVGGYVWQTYQRVAERRDAFGSGLQTLKLVEKNPEGLRLMGLYMSNRPEWVIAEQALFSFAAVTVPLYDTLNIQSIASIIALTRIHAVVCSKKELSKILQLPKIFKEERKEEMSLKVVVVVDQAESGMKEKLKAVGIEMMTMHAVEASGKSNPMPHRPPAGRDIASFCFTSGTTGESKGAIITHENIVSDSAAVHHMGMVLEPSDVHLSYLPLAHMLERMVQFSIVLGGGSIGFYQGDVKELKSDLLSLHPTVFPTVPRVLNRFYDAISRDSKAAMLMPLINKELSKLAAGSLPPSGLITNAIKKGLGLDRVRLVLTGSAPVTAKVLQFFRLLLGVPIVEGYGQTEATAASTLTFMNDYSVGHVGGPIPSNEITLFDVPELGYLQSDEIHVSGDEQTKCIGRGEIALRGPNVMSGYYKMADKTAEILDSDGWLHTGDIGLIMPNGALKIFDRKKNIFKLAQGEYVAPEKLENIYQSSLISQIFVHGDSVESSIIAVIVPNVESLKKMGLDPENTVEVTKNKKLREAIAKDLQASAAKYKLSGFEKIKAFFIEPEAFTVDNGLLTPTFKLKRQLAKQKYQTQIKQMYVSLKANEKPPKN